MNQEAAKELKQQCATGSCPPPQANWGRTNPFNLRPGEVLLSVDPVMRPVRPGPTSIPSAGQPSAGNVAAAVQAPPRTIPATGGQNPQPKSAQILLFLDSSQQSRKIENWFRDDSALAALRAKTDFQVYTTQSPLYVNRYAELVPADQFPVVLMQDRSGGHIHAAGKQFIPSSAAELYKDLRAGYELYQQAKQGAIQMTGALKSGGYSWDDGITPGLIAQSDCVGPLCPNPAPEWQPFRPGGGGLFDGSPVEKRRQGPLAWLGDKAVEVMVGVAVGGFCLVLFGVLCVTVLVFAIRRLMA